MRSETDEMNLTAYALGELEGAQREAVQARLAGSDADRRFVEEVRSAARVVSDELSREQTAGLDAIHYAAIELRLRDACGPRPEPRRDWIGGRIGFALSLAASIVIIGGTIGILLFTLSRNKNVSVYVPQSQSSGTPVLIPLETAPPEGEGAVQGSVPPPSASDPFIDVADHPVSTFAMNTDTASYDEVRNAIYSNRRPTRDSIKIEGLINAFTYDDPAPPPGATFGGSIEIGQCPWQPDHRLARIAVKARQAVGTVAQAARTEVAFAPKAVKSYRLLGCDRDASTHSTEGEPISGGHSVTALYELVPTTMANTVRDELLTLRVRYKADRGGPEQVVQFIGRDAHAGASAESADFRFAAAVAEFGLLLRGPPGAEHITGDGVIALADSGRGTDKSGQRAQFIEMARRAKQLMGELDRSSRNHTPQNYSAAHFKLRASDVAQAASAGVRGPGGAAS